MPLRQRLLRADHGQADLLLFGEADEAVEVVGLERHVDAVLGGAGVAGGAVNALDPRRLGQLPNQGVFAAALAEHQDFHAPTLPRERKVILGGLSGVKGARRAPFVTLGQG